MGYGRKKARNNLRGKSITSFDDLSISQISNIFEAVPKMKKLVERRRMGKALEGQIIALLFFEPSSRTFSSFSSAIKRLGGQTIEYQNPAQTSSSVKGETLEDTIKTFETYSNGIVMRHFVPGAPRIASEVSINPVINAGDGAGEHPTQALLDLYTIKEKHGKLSGLTGLIAGDLLNGRTVHSLLRGFSMFKNNTIYLLSPSSLRLNREDYSEFKKRGLKLIEIEKESQMPKDADFWYWTRVQKERFKSQKEYEKVKTRFVLTPKLASQASKKTIFMHPLPRVGEIDEAMDQDPRSLYFRNQIRNGLLVRMALLSLIFTK